MMKIVTKYIGSQMVQDDTIDTGELPTHGYPITGERRIHCWAARIVDPPCFAEGSSEADAIGNLLLMFPNVFGVDLRKE